MKLVYQIGIDYSLQSIVFITGLVTGKNEILSKTLGSA